jgi:membrane associated rhomboid family serine protease
MAHDVEINPLISLQIEREMGSGGFILTYAAAGIFGNVLGGNFALVGSPSVGASGAIFGTIAVSPSVASMRAVQTFPVGHMGGLVCPLEISP